MGKEVRRVHIDFDWFETHPEPKGGSWSETWKGYLIDLEIVCYLCDGKGVNSKNKKCPLCYGTKSVSPVVEPPKGWDYKKTNGYQIWQTVSEGSPISPVFLKPEELAKWMTENDKSVSKGTSYEAWLKMIMKEGNCPSGIMTNEGYKDGMSLYENKEKENE